MARLLMIVVLLGGLFYIYSARNYQPPPPMPRPPVLNTPPGPVLSQVELEKVRASTKDSDPQVRWAAVELLYNIHDPAAVQILQNLLAMDTEPAVRRKALDLLKGAGGPNSAKELLLALKDSEKDIRVAALMALGETAGTDMIPELSEMLKDVEPEVRLQALHSMASIQERKRAQYLALVTRLKAEYEESLRRQREGSGPLRHLGDVPTPR